MPPKDIEHLNFWRSILGRACFFWTLFYGQYSSVFCPVKTSPFLGLLYWEALTCVFYFWTLAVLTKMFFNLNFIFVIQYFLYFKSIFLHTSKNTIHPPYLFFLYRLAFFSAMRKKKGNIPKKALSFCVKKE